MKHLSCMMCEEAGRDGHCTWPDNNGPKPCEETRIEKPPLGLIPHSIWVDTRIVEILAAMESFAEAQKPAPIEWTQELWKLVDERLGGGILPDEE